MGRVKWSKSFVFSNLQLYAEVGTAARAKATGGQTRFEIWPTMYSQHPRTPRQR